MRSCLRPSPSGWSANTGVIAAHVLELGLVSADDSVIFDAARSGRAAVVMTKDDDFLKLLERHGPPPQIVW